MRQATASDMARKSFTALLQEVQGQGDFSPDDMQELLASCEIGFLVLERLWRLAKGYLDRGMERKKMASLINEAVDVIDLGIKTFDIAREKIKAAGLRPEETSEGLAALELQRRRAAEMHTELSLLLHWLETPSKTTAEMALPAGREDKKAEGYIDLDDLTARMLSRGDA